MTYVDDVYQHLLETVTSRVLTGAESRNFLWKTGWAYVMDQKSGFVARRAQTEPLFEERGYENFEGQFGTFAWSEPFTADEQEYLRAAMESDYVGANDLFSRLGWTRAKTRKVCAGLLRR